MSDAYRLEELRFVSEYSQATAAGGTSIDTTTWVVPTNTIRTLLLASMQVDVGEAHSLTLKVLGATTHSVVGPKAYDTNLGAPIAMLEQGNEVRLLPGDRLRLDRDIATAGSIMTLRVRYIDSIMPFQTHVDPYNPARRRSPFLPNPGTSVAPSGGGGGVVIDGGRGSSGGGGGTPELV